MKLKNKEDLVNFVKHQTNVELMNDPKDSFNNKKNILYTVVSDRDRYAVLPLLCKYGIKYEKHLKDKYWVYVN